nr:hypothetical protein [Tanacetum cinerariifolium]
MQDDLLNQMRNFIQNFQNGPPGEDKEHEATTDTELLSTEDIQPLPVQEPSQNSDMHQIIEECCVESSEEQKQKMEDTMLDLFKICHHKQFLCIHDDEVKNVEEQPAERRNHAERSLQNFRVIHKSSISLNTSQISSIHADTPILSIKEPENSLSMGYEHLSINPETKSDEVTKSNAKNLLPIPSECEVALEDKRECDLLISENSPVYNNSDTFSDSEEEEVDLEDISQVQDIVLREKLFSITRLISNIESLKDNSTPDRVLNSFESDNSFLDNFSPEFETFYDHSEETRSVAPILSTKEREHLLSMRYEHLSITPETDEVTESNAENLLPIPNESEVALEDKRECDLLISENSPVYDNSDTLSDFEINNDISVYDDDFKNIEYVEASLFDPEIVNVEEENVVQQEEEEEEEEEEVDFEDISQIQDVILHNSTPDRVLNSFESDNSLLDNFLPEFETFYDHSKETRSGNTTHANYSLPEYDS